MSTCVSSMQVLNHGSRWPTIGAASARYTRGSTDECPGVIINRIGGASSPIADFASRLICATSTRKYARGFCWTGLDFPASDGRSQPTYWLLQVWKLNHSVPIAEYFARTKAKKDMVLA